MKFICEGEEVKLGVITELSGLKDSEVIEMAKESGHKGKINIDGWMYEVIDETLLNKEEEVKKREFQKVFKVSAGIKHKLHITKPVKDKELKNDAIRQGRIFTIEGTEYTTRELADLFGVAPATISNNTRGLKKFCINGTPVKAKWVRVGDKFDIAKDGKWIKYITMTAAEEITGHDYKTLTYHCNNGTYSYSGWQIKRHKSI